MREKYEKTEVMRLLTDSAPLMRRDNWSRPLLFAFEEEERKYVDSY